MFNEISARYDKRSGYLSLNPIIRPHLTLRIGNWANNLSVSILDPITDSWNQTTIDPDIFHFPFAEDSSVQPMQEFLNTIPPEVLKTVKPFTWRRFVLLRMLRHAPEWAEMMQSNPVLALLVADTMTLRGKDPTIFSQMIFQPRGDILQACDLPSNKMTVTFLSKIRFASYTAEGLSDIRRIIRDQQIVHLLKGVKSLQGEYAPILLEDKGILRYPAMRDQLDASPDNYPMENAKRGLRTMRQIVNDTVCLGHDLRITNVEWELKKCRTFERVQLLHADWVDRLNAMNPQPEEDKFAEKYGSQDFPAPPFSKSDWIEPITTYQELHEEGVCMHNCVKTYAHSVMNKEYYIYRVLHPQRATLGLMYDSGVWYVSQLKLAHNKEPSDETREKVTRWLVSMMPNAYKKITVNSRNTNPQGLLLEYYDVSYDHLRNRMQ